MFLIFFSKKVRGEGASAPPFLWHHGRYDKKLLKTPSVRKFRTSQSKIGESLIIGRLASWPGHRCVFVESTIYASGFVRRRYAIRPMRTNDVVAIKITAVQKCTGRRRECDVRHLAVNPKSPFIARKKRIKLSFVSCEQQSIGRQSRSEKNSGQITSPHTPFRSCHARTSTRCIRTCAVTYFRLCFLFGLENTTVAPL